PPVEAGVPRAALLGGGAVGALLVGRQGTETEPAVEVHRLERCGQRGAGRRGRRAGWQFHGLDAVDPAAAGELARAEPQALRRLGVRDGVAEERERVAAVALVDDG